MWGVRGVEDGSLVLSVEMLWQLNAKPRVLERGLAGDPNSRVVSVWMVFKATRPDEITKGLSIDTGEKRTLRAES